MLVFFLSLIALGARAESFPFPLEKFNVCRVEYDVMACVDSQGEVTKAKIEPSFTTNHEDDRVLRLINRMQNTGFRLRGIENNHYGPIAYIFQRD